MKNIFWQNASKFSAVFICSLCFFIPLLASASIDDFCQSRVVDSEDVRTVSYNQECLDFFSRHPYVTASAVRLEGLRFQVNRVVVVRGSDVANYPAALLSGSPTSVQSHFHKDGFCTLIIFPNDIDISEVALESTVQWPPCTSVYHAAATEDERLLMRMEGVALSERDGMMTFGISQTSGNSQYGGLILDGLKFIKNTSSQYSANLLVELITVGMESVTLTNLSFEPADQEDQVYIDIEQGRNAEVRVSDVKINSPNNVVEHDHRHHSHSLRVRCGQDSIENCTKNKLVINNLDVNMATVHGDAFSLHAIRLEDFATFTFDNISIATNGWGEPISIFLDEYLDDVAGSISNVIFTTAGNSVSIPAIYVGTDYVNDDEQVTGCIQLNNNRVEGISLQGGDSGSGSGSGRLTIPLLCDDIRGDWPPDSLICKDQLSDSCFPVQSSVISEHLVISSTATNQMATDSLFSTLSVKTIMSSELPAITPASSMSSVADPVSSKSSAVDAYSSANNKLSLATQSIISSSREPSISMTPGANNEMSSNSGEGNNFIYVIIGGVIAGGFFVGVVTLSVIASVTQSR